MHLGEIWQVSPANTNFGDRGTVVIAAATGDAEFVVRVSRSDVLGLTDDELIAALDEAIAETTRAEV